MTSSCPICWEEFNSVNDRAHTGCGHEFHLSCLSHHLFKTNHDCPCCRTALIQPEWIDNIAESASQRSLMTETESESESESEETESSSRISSSHESMEDLYMYHPITDETLRAVRFLFNAVDREQLEYREDTNSTDIEEECEYQRIMQIPDAEYVYPVNFDAITDHLQSLSFTYTDMVQALFINYYYDSDPMFYEQQMIDRRIYGEMERLRTRCMRQRQRQ